MSEHPRRAALVPIKGYERAKTRLGPVLPPVARARLARELATRVLDALDGLVERGGIEQIVVLTDSSHVAEDCGERGLVVLRDPPDAGLSEVVDGGLRWLDDTGFHEALVVMADLPGASTDALEVVLGPPPRAVPDHHGTGTNVLLFALGAPITTAFGRADSLARHQDALEGLSVVAVEGLVRDLDRPEDLDGISRR